MRKTPQGSQKGFLTIDFMMAMVVTIGCMLLLLRVSLSLISVQIAQYLVFAAARAQSAADLTEQDQIQAGEKKYQSLMKNQGLMAGFFNNGTDLQKKGVIGDFGRVYGPNPSTDGGRESGLPFIGARAEVKLLRLGFTVPFLGTTNKDDNEFQAFVGAMQFREPSQDKCRSFFDRTNRYQAIMNLDTRFRKAQQFQTDYVVMEDSGC